MVEKPINERIKFLLQALNLSARDFSRAVGVADNNTQNYLEPRFAQPKAEYLEKVMLHFESINPIWLLTGKGEAFLNTNEPLVSTMTIEGKKNKGIQSTGNGNNTINNYALDSCKRDLASAQKEIALLTSQLADKERTIQILLKQQP